MLIHLHHAWLARSSLFLSMLSLPSLSTDCLSPALLGWPDPPSPPSPKLTPFLSGIACSHVGHRSHGEQCKGDSWRRLYERNIKITLEGKVTCRHHRMIIKKTSSRKSETTGQIQWGDPAFQVRNFYHTCFLWWLPMKTTSRISFYDYYGDWVYWICDLFCYCCQVAEISAADSTVFPPGLFLCWSTIVL